MDLIILIILNLWQKLGLIKKMRDKRELYWGMEAYFIGRLSVIEEIKFRSKARLDEFFTTKRMILKYRTMLLISEDRYSNGKTH